MIGLLGGVASGKSAVARLFEEAGAHVLNADRMAQAILDQPEMVAQVEERLGPGLAGPEGRINRKLLAQKVFQSEEARRTLEALIHPLVLARIQEELTRLGKGPNLVVLDVPLLLETGLERECDHLVFVETSEEERETRALHRGWSPGERARREKTQLPLEPKRTKSDYILNNSGSLDETRKQVLDLLGRWGLGWLDP